MNEIMKIIELAVSIKPTATRMLTVWFASNTGTVDINVHEIMGVKTRVSAILTYSSYGLTYSEIIQKLTELKDDMDAERATDEQK